MVREGQDKLGDIDILVNSAGAAKRYLPDDLDARRLARGHGRQVLHLHPCHGRRASRMAARGPGIVVNVIGMGGKVATPIHLPGGAANSALMLATVGLAQVYGPKGIRINAINPGATLTDRVKEALRLEAMAATRAKTRCWRRARRACRCGATRPRMGPPFRSAKTSGDLSLMSP